MEEWLPSGSRFFLFLSLRLEYARQMNTEIVGSDPTRFARKDWINACHFHDLSQKEVLAEVARRVSKVRSASGVSAHPMVLLDLDSTLYEVGPRTFEILRRWVDSEESEEFPETRILLQRLQQNHVGYSLRDTFQALAEDCGSHPEVESALPRIRSFWADRFFSDAFLPYDHPYAGAAKFARDLHELGAEIAYLTGRDEPNMGIGTRENLIRDGFPWNLERTHLILKADSEFPDLDHKKGAADFIKKRGPLIASFENEPINLVALYELFPDAMHVFVETVCSEHQAIPARGLYRILGFED